MTTWAKKDLPSGTREARRRRCFTADVHGSHRPSRQWWMEVVGPREAVKRWARARMHPSRPIPPRLLPPRPPPPPLLRCRSGAKNAIPSPPVAVVWWCWGRTTVSRVLTPSPWGDPSFSPPPPPFLLPLRMGPPPEIPPLPSHSCLRRRFFDRLDFDFRLFHLPPPCGTRRCRPPRTESPPGYWPPRPAVWGPEEKEWRQASR